MRKNIFFYIVGFIMLLVVFLFFNKSYRELTTYSELANRHNTVHSIFQNLLRQINNAAILNPELVHANNKINGSSLFFTDSDLVIQQLELLKSSVHDSVNVKIAAALDTCIRSELSWLLKSNVPDSIINHKSPEHIAAFQKIVSLIDQGIKRTVFLIDYRKRQLNEEINLVKMRMTLFIVLSAAVLIYTTIGLFSQRSKRKIKELELEMVMNRINDAIVSVDNNWRYTFLNDAAMATHPFNKADTIGKVIWDVHPEMKGTIFWDKYHEAMLTKNVVEIDSYYAPMDISFSVKVYPSADGLTIFYKDVTESKRAEQQLENTLRAVSDYKYAIDESSIVAVTDQKGIIQHANENFCRISKYSREELIGQDHRIINSGYHDKSFIKNLWTTIANGKIWKGEMKNKAKDGTIYWVDTTIVPFLDEQNKPYQYVAIRSDITERKELEEKQVLFSLIVNSSDDAILSKTLDGMITTWNHGAEKVFGYAAVEIIGKHISILIPAHLQNQEQEINKKIRNGEVIDHYETERIRKDKKIIKVSLTISPIRNSAGNIIGASKISRDVTQQKETEEKLIKSEKIYRTIASSIPGSVICLLDGDFRYLLIEGDMLENLGYSKEKLLGNKAKDVLPIETFIAVKKEFIKVFSGETITYESNSNGYDIISRFIPLKDESNEVYAIMTVAINVTDLKNAQRNISELNRNLEEKIIQRTSQLEAVNKELEAFTYSVSHDLRAPLRAVNGYAQMLEEDYKLLFDNEGKRLLDVIKYNAMKMGLLIDELLEFSRLGRKEIKKSLIDMNELANYVISELSQLTDCRQIIQVRPLHTISGDYALMNHVLTNLISNAIKYSAKAVQPAIEISSTKQNGELIFSVSDNGVGFDMKYAGKLFGVFQRLHAENEFPGTGVGLAIVQRIINKHGGKVWAKGELNKGAVFSFSVPDIQEN